MTLTQRLLHDHAARRIIRARPELAQVRDLSTVDGLTAVQQDAGDEDTAVVAVVRRFDLVSWVRGTVAFAAGLNRRRAQEWRRAFTRTVFLAGNPANLTTRFDFAHVAETGAMAWTAPASAAAHRPLRRLLRTFPGTRDLTLGGDVVIDLPGEPPAEPMRRVLHLAGSGLTVAGALVHLGHLLVEAVLDGAISPGDRLTVRQLPRLVGVPGPFDALRVGVDPADPDRLHALMSVSREAGDD
ncbi:MAG TPA: DUF6182 family protein [Actinophytocola sp.]|uniref:DUF6182 family protein n=1 Tax=Actinophytocola sp. TaxID=1872138 RepID=UPI002DC01C9E|nr:DUF6182 family protein [Actinophytocola sp.]HEU5475258.1 DUF6182 family protein [Actinophytocola sp.]